jgi:hypothetical protein
MSLIKYKNRDYAGIGGSSGGNLNIYSTTEQIIGTWIDGRPIYRKVFDNSEKLYGTNMLNIDVSDLDIDVVINLDAYGTDGDSMGGTSKFTINGTTTNANRIIYLLNNHIIVKSSYYNWYIFIEYVKTTT